MKIEEKIENNLAILKIDGNITGSPETDELHTRIRSLLDDGIAQVILDLHDVKWMNSGGLGVLIACLATLKNSNGTLKLAQVTSKIESLLVITQLNRIFEIFETVEKAVASMTEE
jgi:anti-sigma B factor antagonist